MIYNTTQSEKTRQNAIKCVRFSSILVIALFFLFSGNFANASNNYLKNVKFTLDENNDPVFSFDYTQSPIFPTVYPWVYIVGVFFNQDPPSGDILNHYIYNINDYKSLEATSCLVSPGYNYWFGFNNADHHTASYLAFDADFPSGSYTCENYCGAHSTGRLHFLKISPFSQTTSDCDPYATHHENSCGRYEFKDAYFATGGGTAVFRISTIITGQTATGRTNITIKSTDDLSPQDYITIGIYKVSYGSGAQAPEYAEICGVEAVNPTLFLYDTQKIYFLSQDLYSGLPTSWCSFNFNYTGFSPFPSSSSMFTYLSDSFSNALQPVCSWSTYFSGKFSSNNAIQTSASISSKILLARAYVGGLDDFFGGVPVALCFSIFCLVILGKFLFNFIHKLTTMIKP